MNNSSWNVKTHSECWEMELQGGQGSGCRKLYVLWPATWTGKPQGASRVCTAHKPTHCAEDPRMESGGWLRQETRQSMIIIAKGRAGKKYNYVTGD